MRSISKLLSVALAIGVMCSCVMSNSEKSKSDKTSNDYKVIGYVAGWKGTEFKTFDPNKFTHINYAFANIVDGKVVCQKDFDTLTIPKLIACKKQNPDLKILISVGGWVWSDHFSDVALTKESRAKFVKSSIDFINYWEFDGVDLDWEYPGQLGEDNVFRPEDKINFNLLLSDLRIALDYESEKQNRKDKFLLTIATGADQAYIDNTIMAEAQKYLDFINIMTYDFYNGIHKTTGFHSNLYSVNSRPSDNSCVQSVERHIKAGIPADKLVLGLPFYGRRWTGVVSNKTNGVNQKAESVGAIFPYSEISKILKDPANKKFRDQETKSPYIWNSKAGVFISYDDKESLKLKIEYMKKLGLGGVMFWEYNNDNVTELLDVIDKNI